MGRRFKRFRGLSQQVVRITRRILIMCHCGQAKEETEEDIVPVASVINGSFTKQNRRSGSSVCGHERPLSAAWSGCAHSVSHFSASGTTVDKELTSKRQVTRDLDVQFQTKNLCSSALRKDVESLRDEVLSSRPRVIQVAPRHSQGDASKGDSGHAGHGDTSGDGNDREKDDTGDQPRLRYSVLEGWSWPLPTQLHVRQQLAQGYFGDIDLVNISGEESSGGVFIRKKIMADVGRQEAAILIKCQCDFVVQLLACFTTRGATYLYMPYYSMTDLGFWLRQDTDRQVFDEKMATWILAHLLMAVFHVHSMGFLHLDIKPSNIFINNNGYPVLADFGGAAKMTPLTRSSCYSPGYSSPEVVMDTTVDKMADLWSCAVTFYVVISDEVPTIIIQTVNGTPTECQRINYDVMNFSPVAADFVSSQLKVDKLERLGGSMGIAEVMNHAVFDDTDWTATQQVSSGEKSRLYDLLTELQQQDDSD